MPRLTPGRRYRRRDGTLSGTVTASGDITYPFSADGHTYTAEGRLLVGKESATDLVGPAPLTAAEKPICDVTLADYRRGVRKVMGWGPA